MAPRVMGAPRGLVCAHRALGERRNTVDDHQDNAWTIEREVRAGDPIAHVGEKYARRVALALAVGAPDPDDFEDEQQYLA